jgi:hypothetical protein
MKFENGHFFGKIHLKPMGTGFYQYKTPSETCLHRRQDVIDYVQEEEEG